MMIDTHVSKPSPLVAQLQQQIRCLERGTIPSQMLVHSTGCRALDALFPQAGLRQGSLVEWIEEGPASGAGTLSLLVGRNTCPAERPFVVIDSQQQVYPLSLMTMGFDLSRLVIVRPANERDALWACEETLRSRTAGIVWAQIERLSITAARRLRLAAEESSGMCLLVRPHQALRQSSWADVRLVVEPRASCVESPTYHVSVAYSQGKPSSSEAVISIDSRQGTIDELPPATAKNPLSLVS